MYYIYAAAGILLTAFDLIIKHIVNTAKPAFPIIDGVFHITYAENTGAAFSMFAGFPHFTTVLTIVLILALIGYIIYSKPKKHIELIAFTLMISGGIGNLVNRLTLGYVVDFFDFRLINFAIFNTADVFICVGAGLFILSTFLTSGKKG
ncbi:MAG: signal peptidase II [Clostridia bacterium]|nr:signal peptidase II [Clostridia bacterium]MBR2972636.1 signal peptidase II [Clostridia bacterium]